MIVFRRFAAPLPVVFVAAFAAGAAYAQECKQRRDLNAIHGVEVAAGSNEALKMSPNLPIFQKLNSESLT